MNGQQNHEQFQPLGLTVGELDLSGLTPVPEGGVASARGDAQPAAPPGDGSMLHASLDAS